MIADTGKPDPGITTAAITLIVSPEPVAAMCFLILDQVVSYWAHFTVHRFICVYLCVFCVFLFHTA